MITRTTDILQVHNQMESTVVAVSGPKGAKVGKILRLQIR